MDLQTDPDVTLFDYRGLPDRFDACVSNEGTMRAGWAKVSRWIESAGPEGLAERGEQLQQLIHDNGATFTVEGDALQQGRPWKLAPVTVVIDAATWQGLTEGLRQRARLLEALLNDLLGPKTLLTAGVVPPELLWNNPRFARQYHGLTAATEAEGETTRLFVTASDLARGEDGAWCVTGDRTRAPSGLGYLLENRIVTSQVHSQLIRSCNVQRLASFFVRLQSRLQALAPRMRDNPRVVLLTPGPHSYRYFEDVFLARYLGLTLVQGSDLAVRGERLNLKTLGGLLPIEVVWRHVSDFKCDPLELDPSSTEGVTDLLRMVRRGAVTIANALGSELAQAPGLVPFLPAACQHLLSEELRLPSLDTYWCGGQKERQHVLAKLDRFCIRSAFLIDANPPVVMADLDQAEREQWRSKIEKHPEAFVAHPVLRHATTPVWSGNDFQPWHLLLRAFQLLDGEDIDVLPGGLARVSPRERDLLGSPTAGQLTVDCWICDPEPVTHEVSLLPNPNAAVDLQRGGNDLPSRVAEHLFWLGRYVERCEAIARLLRTTLSCLANESGGTENAELPKLVAALAGVGQIEPDYAIEGLDGGLPDLEIVLPASVFSRSESEGLQSSARAMVRNAQAVRDRLSVDAYRIIGRIGDELDATPPVQTGELGPALERLNRLIVDLLAFAGLSGESMTRTHDWRFLQLGRRIERTYQTAELLSAALAEPAVSERPVCEAVLQATDSLMTYTSRYLNLIRPMPVIDLLVTDTTNPRSLAYQLISIDQAIDTLPREADLVRLEPCQRRSRELRHAVELADPDQLGSVVNGRRTALAELLRRITDGLPKLSDAIVAQYLFHTSVYRNLTGGIENTLVRGDAARAGSEV